MASKQYFELRDGGKIPKIGFGTYNNDTGNVEEALNAALEYGYRLIDTAYIYNNESIIGKVLKEWLTSGKIKRDELFITTKLPGIGMYKDKVEQYIEESLRKLQLDYVDLYLIHAPIGLKPADNQYGNTVDPETNFIEVWKAMEEQVKNKRTRYIGLSNFNVKQIERVLKNCTIKPVNLQIELHVRLQQNDLINFCKRHDITVTAYCPLGNPSFNEILRNLDLPTKELPVVLEDLTVRTISKKHNRTAAQILLKFLLQKDLIIIPKSATRSRILENISLFDFELDKNDMDELNKLDVGEKARICDFHFMGWSTHPDFPFVKC